MESKTLTRVKSHVKAQVRTSVLAHCSHHLIAGHNKNQSIQNNVEFNIRPESEMFQEFPYHCDLPKPLLPPSKNQRDRSSREDASMQLIYTKAKIQDDINRYMEMYKKYSATLDKNKKTTKVEWKKENKNISTMLPKYVAETAEILERDPDPNFSGSYNWYYSGGTLNCILYDTKNILIFPYAGELIILPIDLKDDSTFKPDYNHATKTAIKDNIYQIVCTTIDNFGRILIRQKHNCFIYNLHILDKKELHLIESDKKSSDIPYVSADLDPSNINKYCTVNVNRFMAVWDIKKSKPISHGKVSALKCFEDNWAFIKYDESNENILKFIDRHCVHHYDTRLSINRSVLTMCPKDNLEECESLSCYIASCKSDYYSYIGSNHSLCLLDQRSPKTPVIKKWTHQFKSSPLFADVCFRENKEFLIFASQLAGEKSIVLNTWNSSELPPESCSTPFSPPNCIETLMAAQLQGKCLSPHLPNRLLLCNTGCMSTVDKESGDIFLFTQNSMNDIFYQGIGYNEHLDYYSLENCKSQYKLKMWDRQILKNSNHDITTPLVVTKRTNARNMFRNFTNQKLVIDDNQSSQEIKTEEFSPKWKRSVAELNSFIDILAPELLAPWEMIEDTPLVPIAAAPYQKVLSWLGYNKDTQEQNETKDNNDTQQPTFLDTAEEPENKSVITHNSESIQQLFLPKVVSQPTPKTKKNLRRSYVPGF